MRGLELETVRLDRHDGGIKPSRRRSTSDTVNACRPRISSVAKLFGQPQHAPAFSEPVRDGLHRAHFEEQAELKSRF